MALFPVIREAVPFNVGMDSGEEIRYVSSFQVSRYGVLATLDTGVSHYTQGMAVDTSGAVLIRVEAQMPAEAAWVGGIPVDRLTGQILCTHDPVVVYSNGLPFAASGLLCAHKPPDNLIGEDDFNLIGEDGPSLYSEN